MPWPPKFDAMRSLLLCISILALVSCGAPDRHEDAQVLYYNEAAGLASLDPAFANNQEAIWWCGQIYNGLVSMDADMRVRPSLAERWEISDDGRTYTFSLRDDVYFQPHELLPADRKMTAQDVVYSFSRILDPEVVSPGLWLFDRLDTERPFRAIDDTTFEIRLAEPFPPFLGLLTMPYCYVVPREVVEHYGRDFRSHPVGTGPFMMNFWYEDTRLALVKNPLYFEFDSLGQRLPYLDAVSVSFVRDRTTQFLDFLKGEYDMMSGIYNEYKNELLTADGELSVAYADRFYLLKEPYLKTDYLGILMDNGAGEKGPLTDRRVRQAIDHAIDREKMVRFIKNNAARPATTGFLPPSCLGPYADSSRQTNYDLNESKRLLAAAGHPNGEGLGEVTLSTTSGYVELCEFVQYELSKIGLKVKVDVLPTSSHREGVSAGRIEFFRKSWIADYSDGENFLALFYGPNSAPRASNYTRFSDARYDSLYEASMRLTDQIDRQRLYLEMNEIIRQEAPVIPLFYDEVMRFVSKEVEGVESNAMNQLFLSRAKKRLSDSSGVQ